MLKKQPVITLTSDFGMKDPFVGIMKGVIYGINPEVKIIDISHHITPHNIHEAAYVLSMAYKYFPPASIHVAVIDPGVGAQRRPILVVTDDYYFIGPDNGVFSFFFDKEQSTIFKVIHLNAPHFFLPVKGPTFHGRDIFAPVAAWLSRGIRSFKFGDTVDDYVRLSVQKAEAKDDNTIEGEVVHIDIFGNAITNITNEYFKKLSAQFSRDKINILYKDERTHLAHYYAESEHSGLSAVLNSFDCLELFIYRDNASKKYGIQVGDKVSVTVS
jgi:S-adenosylmethionine hydrolase